MYILAAETKYTSTKGVRTSAVDWWRTINPMKHIEKNTPWNVTITKDIARGIQHQHAEEHWSNVMQTFDLVWASYFYQSLGYSWLIESGKWFNTPVNIDVDDDLINLEAEESNPVAQMFVKDPESYFNIKTIIADVPNMTVSTSPLRKVYKRHKKAEKGSGEIKVIPNYIDLETYVVGDLRRSQDTIRIGYHGGVTHYYDLVKTSFLPAISYILGKYEGKVVFDICGFLPDTIVQDIPYVTSQTGTSDFYEWIDLWKKWSPTIDIAVAPLGDTEFNKSKSNIKWQENAAAHIPLVASDVGPYKMIKHGVDGFKANSVEQWIEYLSALIENEELRRTVGEQAYKEVETNWNMSTKYTEYVDYICQLTGHENPLN